VEKNCSIILPVSFNIFKIYSQIIEAN